MAEDRPMTRQWNVFRILASRRLGVSVQDLAAELGVSVKTIRRDLDVLREQGLPLEERTEEFGRKAWKLPGDWAGLSVQFNFEEAAALYVARQLLESMAGTPFWSAANRAWRKVRSTLGQSASDYLDRFPRMFHCTQAGRRDYASKGDILESLTIAIDDYKAVHITYRSEHSTEAATRDVYPLRLVRNYTGALYLVAVAPQDDAIKTYKVDRIEAVAISAFVFQRYRDYDVEARLAGSLGIYDGDGDIAVVIRFLPSSSRHARESRWHTSEVFEPQRDGGLILRLRLSSTVEIKSRVLGYGASAVVLEPESLRAEVAEELRRMLAAYEARIATPTTERAGCETSETPSPTRDQKSSVARRRPSEDADRKPHATDL